MHKSVVDCQKGRKERDKKVKKGQKMHKSAVDCQKGQDRKEQKG